MRRIAWLGAALVLLAAAAWLVQAQQAAAPAAAKSDEATYLGALSCKACHNSVAKGEQYKKWEASAHAQAFKVLSTDAAKAVAAKLGLKEAPDASPQCLKCHVTGHGAKPEQLGPKYDKAEGITCEACHGPASKYKTEHMKGLEAGLKAGMLATGEKTCLACHNEGSPTYKPFKYAEACAKIAHDIPPKAK
jgi:hypothetical protein